MGHRYGVDAFGASPVYAFVYAFVCAPVYAFVYASSGASPVYAFPLFQCSVTMPWHSLGDFGRILATWAFA